MDNNSTSRRVGSENSTGCYWRSQTRPWYSNLGTWVLAKKELRGKTQPQKTVYLESHSIWRNVPKEQFTEAKEGPLQLRRKRQGKSTVGGGGGERKGHREGCTGFPSLEVFIWRSQKRIQQNIHQLSKCILSESWSPLIGWRQGRGHYISQCSCSWWQPWHHLSGFAAFLGLELNTAEV